MKYIILFLLPIVGGLTASAQQVFFHNNGKDIVKMPGNDTLGCGQIGPDWYNLNAQCKFRLINQSESTIRVKIPDMSLDTLVAPGDTTRYWIVDSIRKTPLYELDVDGGKYASNPGHQPGWIYSGNWELIFRWSDRRQVFFSVMNQTPEN